MAVQNISLLVKLARGIYRHEGRNLDRLFPIIYVSSNFLSQSVTANCLSRLLTAGLLPFMWLLNLSVVSQVNHILHISEAIKKAISCSGLCSNKALMRPGELQFKTRHKD